MTQTVIFHMDEEWRLEEVTMQPGWYFWDESWSSAQGPHASREICAAELEVYTRELLSERPVEKKQDPVAAIAICYSGCDHPIGDVLECHTCRPWVSAIRDGRKEGLRMAVRLLEQCEKEESDWNWVVMRWQKAMGKLLEI